MDNMDNMDIVEKHMLNIISSYNTDNKHKIHLFLSYYKDNNETRRKEIETAIKINSMNKLFSKIFIVNETNELLEFLELNDRIHVINNTNRLTFNDFFILSNKYTDENTINILINSDIIIGENFDNINIESNQMFCISRHEIIIEKGQGEGKSESEQVDKVTSKVDVGGGSHDCWVWKNKIAENVGNFYMGKFLCDGVLANQLQQFYLLKNPMIDMKIYHLHTSNIRNYSFHDHIKGHRTGITFSNNNNIFSNEDIYYDGCN